MAKKKQTKGGNFSIGNAVSYGWKTATSNLTFFVLLLVIMFAINIIPGLLSSYFEDNGGSMLGFLSSLVGWGLQLLVSLGVIGIALRIYDRKKAAYAQLFKYVHLIIPYFFACILYGLLVFVGLLLLIVPGIYWAIKYRYYTYFMVDKNMGPIEALKASGKITQGQKWKLFFLGIVLALINIVGALALLVGLFVTIPLTMMAEAYVFRKLSTK